MKELIDSAPKKTPVLLIGNKIDATEKRVVSTEEGKKLAENYGCDFMEISVKDNINVHKAFSTIVGKILFRLNDEQISPGDGKGIELPKFRTRYTDIIPNKKKCCNIL